MEQIVGSTGVMIFLIFVVLLAILWFILPFAIFGTKPILREKLAVDREMLAELKAVRALLETAQAGEGGSGSGKPPLVAGR